MTPLQFWHSPLVRSRDTADRLAAGLAPDAIRVEIPGITPEDDPELVERRAKGIKAKGTLLQLEPLKNIQVWRFSLYYFFVFGAFVALSLWLPRYLMGVYGLDIKMAGLLAAAFSIPASLFRVYGGYLSDRYGARAVMYVTFGVAAVNVPLPGVVGSLSIA